MTHFPDSLRNIIALDSILEPDREELIRNVDQETKRVALEWLQSHPLALQTSHRLRRIHQLFQEEGGNPLSPSVFGLIFGDKPLFALVYNPLAPLEKFIEDPKKLQEKNNYGALIHCVTTNKNALPILLNCHSSGTLSLEALQKLLLACVTVRKSKELLQLIEGFIENLDSKELEVLFKVIEEGIPTNIRADFLYIRTEFLRIALPVLFDKLSFEKVTKLLYEDKNPLSPLHDKDSFYCFLQFAKGGRLDFEKLKAILSMPLFSRDNFSVFLEFAKEHLTFEQLETCLNIQNKYPTPLLVIENLYSFLEFAKENLTFEQLKACLSIENRLGVIPLQGPENLHIFLEITKEFLTLEEQKELMSMPSSLGFTPLHMSFSIDTANLLIKLFSPEERIELLHILSKDGDTLLHGKTLPIIAALLKGIPKEEALNLLYTTNNKGETFLHRVSWNNLYEKLHIFLEENKKILTPQDLQKLIYMRDENGKTPLHSGKLQGFLELNERWLSFKFLKELLLTQDNDGNTPLHDPVNLQNFLNFEANKLSFQELQAALSMQNREGATPLHNINISQSLAFELVKMFPPQTRAQLLSILNGKNETPLHDKSFPVITALLEGIPEEEALGLLREGKGVLQDIRWENHFTRDMNFIQLKKSLESLAPSVRRELFSFFFFLLLTREEDGKTPLHDHRLLSSLLPLLEKLDDEAIKELFSLQDEKGNTPLHYFPNPQKIESLLHRVGKEVLTIKNQAGISALSSFNFASSAAWLRKLKPLVIQEELSKREYRERAHALKEELFSLWDSLSFGRGEGKVPENYLEARIGLDTDNLRSFTPNEVKRAFSTMLKRIEEETAWLGTPPTEQEEDVHTFYTPMLLNLERIVQKLREREDPIETAGVLFSIAKIELEERCAAAYQGEIEQAAALVSGNELELTTDALLEKCAKNTLIEVIEKKMKEMRSTDVHTYNQFAYAAGLLSAPDPLSSISVERCRVMLEESWSLSSILPRLTSHFREIPTEQMIDWLKEKIPESFDLGYLALKNRAQELQEEILRSTEEKLLERDLNEEKIEHILAFFSSSLGASLTPLPEVFADTREEVKLAFAHTIKKQFPLIELTEELIETHMPENLDEESLLTAFDALRRTIQIRPVDRLLWQNSVKAFTQSLLNAQKIKKESFMRELPLHLQNEVLQLKRGHDEKMKNVVTQLENSVGDEVALFINLKECGLPSNGIENSRKMAFAASLFDIVENSGQEEGERQQLTAEGAAFSAMQIGVFEELLQDLF